MSASVQDKTMICSLSENIITITGAVFVSEHILVTALHYNVNCIFAICW